jgi:hypothetical protein
MPSDCENLVLIMAFYQGACKLLKKSVKRYFNIQ